MRAHIRSHGRGEEEEEETCPKLPMDANRLESIHRRNKQSIANRMKFNWRANWEILLVLVIIIIGIVITTIAAIRSRDKQHLLVLSDDTGDYGGGAGLASDHQSVASLQVPPLPHLDFQFQQSGSDELVAPAAKSSPYAAAATTSTRRPNKSQPNSHLGHHQQLQQRPGALFSDGKQARLRQQSNRSSATTPATGSTTSSSKPDHDDDNDNGNGSTSQSTLPNSDQIGQTTLPVDTYDASSTETTPPKLDDLLDNDNDTMPLVNSRQTFKNSHLTGRGNSRNQQQQRFNGHHNQMGEQQVDLMDDFHATRSSLAPPINSDPTIKQLDEQRAPYVGLPKSLLNANLNEPYELSPSLGVATSQQHLLSNRARAKLMQGSNLNVKNSNRSTTDNLAGTSPLLDNDDMMTSYTRMPHNNNDTASLFRDYNSALANSYNATNGESLMKNLKDRDQDQDQLQLQNLNSRVARQRVNSATLPFSMLLNDIIRLARPSYNSPDNQAGQLEQPANSRPNLGILQQLRSLPGPLLSLLQGGQSSNSQLSTGLQADSSIFNGISNGVGGNNQLSSHDASESSQHYQRIFMSPSDMSMILSRSLRAAGSSLPAFPAPKGVPQAWIPPTSGGLQVNDATGNNADFVAGNTAGFVRASAAIAATSNEQPSSSSQQSPLSTNLSGDNQQQQQQQSMQQLQQQDNQIQYHQQQPVDQQQIHIKAAQYTNEPIASNSRGSLDETYRKQSMGLMFDGNSQAPLNQAQQIHHQNSFMQQQQQQNNIFSQQMQNTPNVLTAGIPNQKISDQQQQQMPFASQAQMNNQRQISEIYDQHHQQVPLSYNGQQFGNAQQLMSQQQMVGQPMRQLNYDFGGANLIESASKLSGQIGPSSSGQQTTSTAAAAVNSHRLQAGQKLTDLTQRATISAPQSQPIQLNTINSRQKRNTVWDGVDSSPQDSRQADRREDFSESTLDDDEEAEYLDSRPMSIVSPDGRPMSGKAVKIMRLRPTDDTGDKLERSSSQRQANHLDLDESALHHYASSDSGGGGGSGRGSEHQEIGSDQLIHEDRGQKGIPSKLRHADKLRGKKKKEVSLKSSNKTSKLSGKNAATGVRKRNNKSNLDTASSGLMSKLLLGTASSNDEVEDDLDNDHDDDDEARERRKEEQDEAEFGIANVGQANQNQGLSNELAQNLQDSLEGGGGGGGGGENSSRLRQENAGQGAEPESSVGSGSAGSNSYSRRQQQRADVDFYGHPGEETRQLKYGILGSGNYEVVNGGIYPDVDESTAAVNSVANYVRKPGANSGILLANLPKLLAAAGAGSSLSDDGPRSGFGPGTRMGRPGGFMRGASDHHDQQDDLVGMFPTPQSAGPLADSPLMDLIHANGGGHLFDPNSLIANLGSSDSSAQTTFSSRDEDKQDDYQLKSSLKRYNGKQRSKDDTNHHDEEQLQRQPSALAKQSSFKATNSKSKTKLDRDELNNDHNYESQATRHQMTGSKSQGTNQFYSYQILPSKKVTIFSDQDLDSAPSEETTLWSTSSSNQIDHSNLAQAA